MLVIRTPKSGICTKRCGHCRSLPLGLLLKCRGNGRAKTIPVFADVAPLQTISLSSQIFRITDEPLKIPFSVKNYFPNKAAGRVEAIVPAGWDALNTEFVIGREDSVYTDSVTIIPPPLCAGNVSGTCMHRRRYGNGNGKEV